MISDVFSCQVQIICENHVASNELTGFDCHVQITDDEMMQIASKVKADEVFEKEGPQVSSSQGPFDGQIISTI